MTAADEWAIDCGNSCVDSRHFNPPSGKWSAWFSCERGIWEDRSRPDFYVQRMYPTSSTSRRQNDLQSKMSMEDVDMDIVGMGSNE